MPSLDRQADGGSLAFSAGFRHIDGANGFRMPCRIPFRKMNGLGNEFIVFDGRTGPVRLPPTRSARSASDASASTR